MYKPVCIWRCRSLLATLSPLWPNVSLPNHRQIPTLCLRTRQTQPVKKCVPCRPSHPSSLCDLLGNERRWLLTKGRCGCKSPWITKAGEAFCCGGVDVEVCQRMRRDTEDSRWIAGIRMVGLHVWKKWQEVKETRRWWGDAADNCQWRERGHTVKLWQLPLRLWELRLQRGRLRFVSQKKKHDFKNAPNMRDFQLGLMNNMMWDIFLDTDWMRGTARTRQLQLSGSEANERGLFVEGGSRAGRQLIQCETTPVAAFLK